MNKQSVNIIINSLKDLGLSDEEVFDVVSKMYCMAEDMYAKHQRLISLQFPFSMTGRQQYILITGYVDMNAAGLYFVFKDAKNITSDQYLDFYLEAKLQTTEQNGTENQHPA